MSVSEKFVQSGKLIQTLFQALSLSRGTGIGPQVSDFRYSDAISSSLSQNMLSKIRYLP